MYLSHYGLDEPPFRITPVTDFFYGGANRAAILEALIYAITHGEGMIKVVGEVGTGKTMMCRVLMERLPAGIDTIYLADPTLTRDEIVYAIADELGLDLAGQRAPAALRSILKALIERFAAGRRVVLLIDEAHAMPLQTLEEVRLLSNLETSRDKLLQIVLFGQPELDDNLRLPQMRQLKDRIIHHFSMQPLTEPAVKDYLSFRMRAAGYKGPDVFSTAAVRLIARASQGLTRRVNILADKALLAAFVANTHGVEAKHVKKAIGDSQFDLPPRRLPVSTLAAATAALGVVGVAVVWMLTIQTTERAAPPAQALALRQGAPPVPAAETPAPAPSAAPAPAVTVPESPAVAPASAAPAASTPSPAPATEPVQQEEPKAADATPAGAPPAPSAAALGNARLLKDRVEATRQMLASTPAASYTIHLFVTNDGKPERVEEFLTRAERLVDFSEVYVLASRYSGRNRYRVTYGHYASLEEAEAAMEKLPERYRSGFRLQLTTLGELRRAG